jgi:uncharacterized protein
VRATGDTSGDERQIRFCILSIDGGGIRGLIPALVIAELERRLRRATHERRPVSDYVHLFAGTSTGGLIALGLTAPDGEGGPRMDGEELVALYREEGPRIFHRSMWQKVRSLWGWIGPKYSTTALEDVVKQRIGPASLSGALREVMVVAYDMTDEGPQFFKRWRAREADRADPLMADAAMATACAPTYFPSWPVPSTGGDGRALVDGGVFAANPTVAAISEALKRRSDEPADLDPRELLVVSLGTGEPGRDAVAAFQQRTVRRWGRLQWIWPRDRGPALLNAIFDGQSEAADHWAHTVINSEPGDPASGSRIGHGPRYFRLQADLTRAHAMDDASEAALDALARSAERLIAERGSELDQITDLLIATGPIPPGHDT